jgi:predicted lactoylglutathione lyase
MSRKLFVNLPVKDLKKSIAFFTALGFSFNPQFTDETATCMIISEENYAMLLTHEKFASFSPNPISDAWKSTEVLISMNCESRDEVMALAKKAIDAGGKRVGEPTDHGFMYEDGFQDLDGHGWGIFYMDPSFVQKS